MREEVQGMETEEGEVVYAYGLVSDKKHFLSKNFLTLTSGEDARCKSNLYPAQERKKLSLSWFEPWKGTGEVREPPKKRYKEIFMT